MGARVRKSKQRRLTTDYHPSLFLKASRLTKLVSLSTAAAVSSANWWKEMQRNSGRPVLSVTTKVNSGITRATSSEKPRRFLRRTGRKKQNSPVLKASPSLPMGGSKTRMTTESAASSREIQKKLVGRAVDEDGDIIDKKGNVVGHAER